MVAIAASYLAVVGQWLERKEALSLVLVGFFAIIALMISLRTVRKVAKENPTGKFNVVVKIFGVNISYDGQPTQTANFLFDESTQLNTKRRVGNSRRTSPEDDVAYEESA